MTLSQNVCFNVNGLDSEEEHPPGFAVASVIQAAIAQSSWDATQPDNWRDVGWEILSTGEHGAAISICLAQFEQSRWMVQVAPSKVPGFFGRLFGKYPSATSEQVHQLAMNVFNALSNHGAQDQRWCWDDFPDSNESATPEPSGCP